jgi:hypothetical protein
VRVAGYAFGPECICVHFIVWPSNKEAQNAAFELLTRAAPA